MKNETQFVVERSSGQLDRLDPDSDWAEVADGVLWVSGKQGAAAHVYVYPAGEWLRCYSEDV